MAKVALVLTDDFADWEYAMIGGIGGSFYGLEVAYFSPTPGQLSSMGGMTVVVSNGLEELALWQPDVVAVIGGTVWDSEAAPDISDLLVTQYENGVPVGGICGGTLALARSGLLNAEPHTSNEGDFLIKNAVGYDGVSNYVQSKTAVSSDRVVTAPGTAPVSFAAAIFEVAGVPQETVSQFKDMITAEHN
ncbi:DJ-1/PfpI family protein [Ruegeria halocynthiae]|uniref:DJ-1/PfpI family protein n=1 Tax=Ruegeria halocynthiae TaxID=985054 RepID=A0A1H3F5B9_9RHOB|nr:DJ-1/PfpI family protein [Ruegeria halocynthiae]SDX86176.1 DJ-1/PfpI family protein [Ruegeria halocynthiae]